MKSLKIFFLDFGIFLCDETRLKDLRKLRNTEVNLRIGINFIHSYKSSYFFKGLEIFRVVSGEENELTLKHLMRYSKRYRDIGLDFVTINNLMKYLIITILSDLAYGTIWIL